VRVGNNITGARAVTAVVDRHGYDWMLLVMFNQAADDSHFA